MFKKLFTITFVMASAIFATGQAQFEGVIKFKGENKTYGETSELDWYVKSGNSKLDLKSYTKEANSEFSLYFVQGQPNVQMTGSDGAKKVVYDVPYSSFANKEFSTAFSVEATGNKGNYAGYACDEYVVKTSTSTVSCWISNATGVTPASFPSVILGNGVFQILQRNGIQGIPLKITSKDFAGNIITDQEVVSIQASTVPDNTFIVPAGYTKANQ